MILFTENSFSNERSVNTKESFIKWTGKELTTKTHYGKLSIASGNISIENDQISGEVVVDMESLLVEDLQGEWADKLVGHLRSDDFFSVDKFSTSTLKATGSKKTSDNTYQVDGVLTIKGISHPISFEADVNGDLLTSSLTFDRSLYDVRFRSGSFFENLGDKLILDDIELEVTLKLN